MTWFCGWNKRFLLGLAALTCAQAATAAGPFKPSSYGKQAEDAASQAASSRSNAMRSGAMMNYQEYPADPAMQMPPGMMQQGMPPGTMMPGNMPMAGMGGGPMISPAGYESFPGEMSSGNTSGEYVFGNGQEFNTIGIGMGCDTYGNPNGVCQCGDDCGGSCGGACGGSCGCGSCGGGGGGGGGGGLFGRGMNGFGGRGGYRDASGYGAASGYGYGDGYNAGNGSGYGECGNGFCNGMCGGACGSSVCNGPFGGRFGGRIADRFQDHRSVRDFYAGCGGRLRSGLGRLAPYTEGGVATPRYYDVEVGAMFLNRDTDSPILPITSRGVGGGNIVLSTNSVELDQIRAGLMAQINLQIGVGSTVEVSYFGLNRWHESATVTGANDLYSFFTGFGTNPPTGLDDVDRSNLQQVEQTSAIHNGEVNLRRRWAEPNGFFQGSLLTGLRYFDLDEDFTYMTRGLNNSITGDNGQRFGDYSTQTRNQLFGIQAGGDLWYNVVPGIKVGGGLKSGIYGNNAEQASQLTTRDISLGGISTTRFNFVETADRGQTAFLTQLSLNAIYRLNHSFTFKSGYELIYVDNVALATENINTVPLGNAIQRANAVRVDTDGEVTYSGFTLGGEFMW